MIAKNHEHILSVVAPSAIFCVQDAFLSPAADFPQPPFTDRLFCRLANTSNTHKGLWHNVLFSLTKLRIVCSSNGGRSLTLVTCHPVVFLIFLHVQRTAQDIHAINLFVCLHSFLSPPCLFFARKQSRIPFNPVVRCSRCSEIVVYTVFWQTFAHLLGPNSHESKGPDRFNNAL